ncbi:mitochondrial import inner membrane translocase subunit TIM16-like [Diabrotica virgifera virgifera]|uniref:Mitochondrial import inner membrane translocase subunit Tim16-like n=1 Tax=Diabrotica virgifera virgifera TaxID=50390 RepID=A0ABM5KF25_DIAVI|nr:mitochondrial import inner membrane translocase subunit TIM16-like [Diabrotica virgifera virgifera]
MVKSLPKVIYHGVKVFLKSVKKSVAEEIALSQQRAKIRYSKENPGIEPKEKNRMSIAEAKLILNVSKLCPKEVEYNFRHLFDVNSEGKGGSFYLQSKILQAKKVLDMELKKCDE